MNRAAYREFPMTFINKTYPLHVKSLRSNDHFSLNSSAIHMRQMIKFQLFKINFQFKENITQIKIKLKLHSISMP